MASFSVYVAAFFIALYAGFLQLLWTATGHADRHLAQASEVVLYLTPQANEADLSSVKDQVIQRFPEIPDISLVTKETAFEQGSKDTSLTRALLLLRDNPFSSSLRLKLPERWWKENQDPGVVFDSMPLVQEVRWDAEAGQLYRRLIYLHDALIRCMVISLFLGFFWAIWGALATAKKRASFTRYAIHQVGIALLIGTAVCVFIGLNFLYLPVEFQVVVDPAMALAPVIGAICALFGLPRDVRPAEEEEAR